MATCECGLCVAGCMRLSTSLRGTDKDLRADSLEHRFECENGPFKR